MKSFRNALLLTILSAHIGTNVWAELVTEPLNTPAKTQVPPLASLTWASKYLSDGFSIGGENSVLQLGLRFPIFRSEFSLMVWSSLQTERENREFDEYDLLLKYQHLFLENSAFAWFFHSYYCYWYYPNSLPIKDSFGDTLSDVQKHGSKIHLGFTFPELIPTGGSYLVPSYNVYYWLYWAQDRKNQNKSGTRHELLLSYEHWLPKLSSTVQSSYGALEGSLNYTDGAFDVKPGWSHVVVSASYGVQIAGSDFVATVHKQWSFEPSLNPKDEIWSSLSIVHLL
jgi:hypothetical protein